jgi:tRNA uridine 5-carboxymethylaminomethyl modification enzyme
MVNDKEYAEFINKKNGIDRELERLGKIIIHPTAGTNDRLKSLGTTPSKNPVSLIDLLRRPEISYQDLISFDQSCDLTDPAVAEEVEIQVKYAGYIQRQEEQIGKLSRLEGIRLPAHMDFRAIPGLTAEVREKLEKVKPLSLGQASRISGITPAAISILLIHLKRFPGSERGSFQPSSRTNQG